MAILSKCLCLCLVVILLASSLLMVKLTNAETIPTPATPQFSMKLADHSYYVQPITTTTINPYNGEKITNTQPGYYVQNLTIDLTIQNQPYPSTIDGNPSFVFFNVQIKGHYGQDWTELYPYYSNSLTQSNGQYTVISLPANYQAGDEIDVQVQAAIGYKIVTYIGHPPLDVYTESVDFQHTTSNWSPTQTFKMPDNSTATPTPTVPNTSTATPTVQEFPITAILSLLIALPLLCTVIVKKRRRLA